MLRTYVAGFAASLALLGGCAGVSVSQGDKEVAGIPFRIKVPVWVQETTIAETGWLVQFEIDDGDAKTPPLTVPLTGSLLIPCATPQQVQAALEPFAQHTAHSKTPRDAAEAIKANLGELTRLAPAAKTDCQEVVSNQLRQEARISNEPYFVTHKIPLFGSGTGAYELNADGTLSKASTTITDDTAKTLLGLFPVKEKLMLRWGVAPAAAFTGAKPVPVDVTLTPRVTLYTLKRDLGGPALSAALSLDEARAGQNGVQLVSTERSDDAPAPKADPKAYRLQGAVYPPEAGN